MDRHGPKLVRGAAAASVSILLVAGAAFAANAVMGTPSVGPDLAPPAASLPLGVSNVAEPSETPEPAETAEMAEPAETPEPAEPAETAETPEPSETPETAKTAEPAEPAETPEPAEMAEPAETPEPAETHDGEGHAVHGDDVSSHDGAGSDQGSNG